MTGTFGSALATILVWSGLLAPFLASEEAKYITGQMLYVDGGILANQLNWDESLL